MPHVTYKNQLDDILPSVTTILRMWGSGDALVGAANKLGRQGLYHRTVWDKLALLGTLVHEVCSASLISGDLESSIERVGPNVPESILDGFSMCCGAWAQCRKEVKLGPALSVEEPLVSESYQYGGCPDAVIVMGQPAVLDFKTGSTWPAHIMQLAAYRELYNENQPDKEKRARAGYLVKLNRESGSYAFKYFPEATLSGAFKVFESILTAHRDFEVLKKAM